MLTTRPAAWPPPSAWPCPGPPAGAAQVCVDGRHPNPSRACRARASRSRDARICSQTMSEGTARRRAPSPPSRPTMHIAAPIGLRRRCSVLEFRLQGLQAIGAPRCQHDGRSGRPPRHRAKCVPQAATKAPVIQGLSCRSGRNNFEVAISTRLSNVSQDQSIFRVFTVSKPLTASHALSGSVTNSTAR
jgi:hypothetical protein